MSKEKIEEMKEIVCDVVNFDICNKFDRCSDCPATGMIESLYNAGYRKQNEGQWTYSENKKTMKCTRCRLRMKTYDVRRYCPNCGAKMTKGENW